MSVPSERRGPGLKVASVAGIPVHIGSSWLLLAALIIFIAASNLPGLGALAYVIGVSYAVSLLIAVLLHEIAHALVAHAFGIPVHRIVADLWGGHTAFDGRGLTPGRSAAIAVAGPATNLALGVIGLGGGALTSGVSGTILNGVGYVNVLLAVFNLLPGLPLDGGQLVDALVWRLTGHRSTGLVVAGWCGRVVAGLVLAWVGLRPLALGQDPSLTALLWGVVIAGFLWTGATGAIRSGRARQLLGASTLAAIARPAREWPSGTPVRDVLASGAVGLVAGPDGSLSLVASPEGMSSAALPPDTPVEAVATRLPGQAIVTADPGDDLTAAALAMQASGWGLVVLTDRADRPYAVITADDLTAALRGVQRPEAQGR